MVKNNFLIITTHISPTKGFGGPAISIRKFVEYLYKIGCKFDVISSVPGLSYNISNEYYFKSFFFHKFGFSPRLLLFLILYFKNYSCIVINGIATFPNLIGIFLSFIFNKKVIVFSRGSFELIRYQDKNMLVKMYYKLNFFLLNLIHNNGKLIVVYQSSFECLKSLTNFKFTHIIVPNFSILEIESMRQLRNDFKDYDLTYCGRDSIEKGTDRLRYFLTSIKNVSCSLRIILIIDGQLDLLKDFDFDCYPHKIQILYSQRHEEILKIFSKSKFYFFGSRVENFGNAFIESIVCGAVPVMFDDTDWSYLLSLELAIPFDFFLHHIIETNLIPEYSSIKNTQLFEFLIIDHFSKYESYNDIIKFGYEI